MNRNMDRSYHLAMSHRGMGAVEKVLLQAHEAHFETWPNLHGLTPADICHGHR